MITGILILAIVGLVTMFSIQNVTSVSVALLIWRFDMKLSALVCVAVLLGIVVQQLIRQWAARRSAKTGNQ